MKYKGTIFLKNNYSISLWVALLFAFFGYSQDNDLIARAQDMVYSNPDESLKITEHLLKTSQDSKQVIVSNLLIAKAQLVKGNLQEAVKHAFNENNLLEVAVGTNTQIELNLLRAKILRHLYLDKQAKDYLSKGELLLKTLPANANKDSLQCLFRLEHIITNIERRNSKEALKLIALLENDFSEFLSSNKTEKSTLYLAKGRAYSNLSQYDSAQVYIYKTLDLLNTPQINDLYQKAVIYKELSYLQLQKKEFKESEKSLFIALTFAEIINNPTVLMNINKDLSIAYLASNKNVNHKIYNEKHLTLSATVERAEQEAVNTYYTMLSNQEDNFLISANQNHNNYLYFLIAGLFFLMVIAVYFILKREGRKKRLKEIINYLEVVRNNEIKTKPVKKSKPKRIAIPEDTERIILSKLKRFEASKKFLNKDISLAVLAGQFETNTKYLSGVINKHYDDNFNTFINKLRVNYIINKLKNDSNYINYKISFLAEESGYSSHSSFATVFKSIVGMTPVTFIKLIQKEREILKKKTTN